MAATAQVRMMEMQIKNGTMSCEKWLTKGLMKTPNAKMEYGIRAPGEPPPTAT